MCEKTNKRISNTYRLQRYKSLRKHGLLSADKILHTQKLCFVRYQTHGYGPIGAWLHCVWSHDWAQFPVPILWRIKQERP